MTDLNIYQRINEVKKEVTYVKKDANVQGYKAVSHDQVTAVLKESMVKNGIIITQSLKESKSEETGQLTGKGAKWAMYTATYLIRFVNIDKPEDHFIVEVESQALDFGDKASGKAMSYAIKYAMLKTFGLETGEDDEGRQDGFKAKQEEKQPISEKQTDVIRKLIVETESKEPALLKYYGIESLELMPSKLFNTVKLQLEAKKDKKDVK